LRLFSLRIKRYAVNRADFLALRLLEMTYTFGALVGVDFIDLFALINRLIRALRLADVAVNALVCDHQSHLTAPLNLPGAC